MLTNRQAAHINRDTGKPSILATIQELSARKKLDLSQAPKSAEHTRAMAPQQRRTFPKACTAS